MWGKNQSINGVFSSFGTNFFQFFKFFDVAFFDFTILWKHYMNMSIIVMGGRFEGI